MIRRASLAGLLLALFAGVLLYAHSQTPTTPATQTGGQPKDPSPTEQKQEAKGKEPAMAEGSRFLKTSRFASNELARTQAILKVLEEEIDMKVLQDVPEVMLRDVLKLLAPRLTVQGRPLRILVDKEAFKAENPKAKDVMNTDVSFQDLPDHVSLIILLHNTLSQVPTRNATFLVRRGVVQITTIKRAAVQALLQEKVNVSNGTV